MQGKNEYIKKKTLVRREQGRGLLRPFPPGSLCGEFTGYRWIHKGPWHAALMFSLIYVWINDWVNNDEGGDLRRNRAHYGVIVMGCVNHKAYHKYGYERKYWKNSTQFWNIKQNLFIINGTETYVQHTHFNKLCYKTGCGRAQKNTPGQYLFRAVLLVTAHLLPLSLNCV